MRLILAHAGDVPARSLAAHWGSEALLVTPAALHRRSWRLEVAAGGAVRATVDLADLDGVVTRLAAVTPAELPHVVEEDRCYVAAELTAFLLAWLDACPRPVVNRPVPGTLNGPPWGPTQWAAAAARAGFRVTAVRQGPATAAAEPADPLGTAPPVRATVVGNRCLGPVAPAVAGRLCQLARAASTPLLGALLEGPQPGARVRTLTAWPDVGDPDVADALDQLLRATPC